MLKFMLITTLVLPAPALLYGSSQAVRPAVATVPRRAGPVRAAMAADAIFGSTMEITDTGGDAVKFELGGTGPELQLFVNGEIFADDIETVTYTRADRRVEVAGTLTDKEDDEVYEVDGDFVVGDSEVAVTVATLAIMAARAGTVWEGDEALALPAELEAKLVDDELKASRPGVSVFG